MKLVEALVRGLLARLRAETLFHSHRLLVGSRSGEQKLSSGPSCLLNTGLGVQLGEDTMPGKSGGQYLVTLSFFPMGETRAVPEAAK